MSTDKDRLKATICVSDLKNASGRRGGPASRLVRSWRTMFGAMASPTGQTVVVASGVAASAVAGAIYMSPLLQGQLKLIYDSLASMAAAAASSSQPRDEPLDDPHRHRDWRYGGPWVFDTLTQTPSPSVTAGITDTLTSWAGGAANNGLNGFLDVVLGYLPIEKWLNESPVGWLLESITSLSERLSYVMPPIRLTQPVLALIRDALKALLRALLLYVTPLYAVYNWGLIGRGRRLAVWLLKAIGSGALWLFKEVGTRLWHAPKHANELDEVAWQMAHETVASLPDQAGFPVLFPPADKSGSSGTFFDRIRIERVRAEVGRGRGRGRGGRGRGRGARGRGRDAAIEPEPEPAEQREAPGVYFELTALRLGRDRLLPGPDPDSDGVLAARWFERETLDDPTLAAFQWSAVTTRVRVYEYVWYRLRLPLVINPYGPQRFRLPRLPVDVEKFIATGDERRTDASRVVKLWAIARKLEIARERIAPAAANDRRAFDWTTPLWRIRQWWLDTRLAAPPAAELDHILTRLQTAQADLFPRDEPLFGRDPVQSTVRWDYAHPLAGGDPYRGVLQTVEFTLSRTYDTGKPAERTAGYDTATLDAILNDGPSGSLATQRAYRQLTVTVHQPERRPDGDNDDVLSPRDKIVGLYAVHLAVTLNCVLVIAYSNDTPPLGRELDQTARDALVTFLRDWFAEPEADSKAGRLELLKREVPLPVQPGGLSEGHALLVVPLWRP